MIDLLEFCSTLQQDLNDIAGMNYPAIKRENTGTVSAMLSPQNTTNFEQIQTDTRDGKTRQVIVRYIQAGEEAEVSTTPISVCEDGVEEGPQSELVNVTRYARSPIMEFTKAELRKLCESSSEWRAQMLQSKINAVMRVVNKDLIAQYAANVGTFVDTTGVVGSAKQVPLVNQDAGGQYSADFWGETIIMDDMDDAGISGRPILSGKGLLSKYNQLKGIGCCNDLGQDVSQIGGSWDWFNDRFVDAQLGTPPADLNYFLAWAPGACQMLTFNENKGEFEEISNTARSAETTFVDPVTGLELDFEFYYDRCTKTYKMMFFLNYDYWVMPNDVYKAGDDRAGINNTFLYQGLVS
jgi:hypothetical protein